MDILNYINFNQIQHVPLQLAFHFHGLFKYREFWDRFEQLLLCVSVQNQNWIFAVDLNQIFFLMSDIYNLVQCAKDGKHGFNPVIVWLLWRLAKKNGGRENC